MGYKMRLKMSNRAKIGQILPQFDVFQILPRKYDEA